MALWSRTVFLKTSNCLANIILPHEVETKHHVMILGIMWVYVHRAQTLLCWHVANTSITLACYVCRNPTQWLLGIPYFCFTSFYIWNELLDIVGRPNPFCAIWIVEHIYPLWPEKRIWYPRHRHIPWMVAGICLVLRSIVTWRYWTLSTLGKVMACWLMAPSHYLDQFWIVIVETHW